MNTKKVLKDIDEEAGQVAITAIIRRRIQNGKGHDYITWTEGISEAAGAFEGYVSTRVIEPTSPEGEFVTIVTFDNYRHYQLWDNSPELAYCLSQLKNIVEWESREYIIGLEHWLGSSDGGERGWPPSWRMVLVAYVAIWPLVHFLSPEILILLPTNAFVASLLSTAIITVLMGYVTLPLMQRLFRKWL